MIANLLTVLFLLILGEACDTSDNMHASNSIHEKQFVNGTKVLGEPELSSTDHYKLGYQECLAETMRFLVELQGFFPTDTLCVKMINHLQKYFEKLAKGMNVLFDLISKTEGQAH